MQLNSKPFLPKKRIVILSSILLLLGALGFTWYYYSPANQEYENINMSPHNTLVDNIYEGTSNKKFASFLAHVGYDTFLQEEGPYTVFVPTDEAYANLPTETNQYMRSPEYEGVLRQIMLYHVIKGKYSIDDFKEGMTLTTVQGETLTLTIDNGWWVINDSAYIEKADINSTNGVIHLITNYLIPPSMSQEEQ